VSNQLKRVTIVIDAFSVGGAQRNLQLLIPEFLSRCQRVDLVLIQENEHELELQDLIKRGLKVHRIKARNFCDVTAFFKFVFLLRKIQSDSIFVNLYWSQIWTSLAMLLNPKSKVFWIEHNTYLNRTHMQWSAFKILSRFANGVFSVSVEIQEFLTSKDIKGVSLVKNCAYPPIAERSAQLNQPVFLFVGRLIEQKNPRLAIYSFSAAIVNELIPVNSSLRIIGDGVECNDLKSLVRDLRLSNNIDFLGFLTSAQVSAQMCLAHCLISTSKHEGSPLVRLEALVNGLCIVTTPTAGIKGILTQNDISDDLIPGVFVVGDDPVLIANALSESLAGEYWTLDNISERESRLVLYHPSSVADFYLNVMA
jgi:glycosyltransferase involved in cell wall biosynthesis